MEYKKWSIIRIPDQTLTIIDFINKNKESFRFLSDDNKKIRFDKIYIEELHHMMEVYCAINSTKRYNIWWSLEWIVFNT